MVLIGGPCVLEEPRTNDLIGTSLKAICDQIGWGYVFKASFDKANRSSNRSKRGPGLSEGLQELKRMKSLLGVPVCTDIHEPDQAAAAADVADLLQIPAFLCRQTDLLVAAAKTGRAVNVKKGQFLSPAEMGNVITKLDDAGCREIMLTERGTFFGYQRLVNDFIGLGDMMALGRPVCFDVTHSTQLPGGDKTSTGGRPDRAAILARAAVAAGVDALFFEAHPEPAKAWSDASTMQSLSAMGPLMQELDAIRRVLKSKG